MSKLHKVSDSQRSRRLASCRSSIPVRYVVHSEGTLFLAKSRLLVLHGNMSVDRTNAPICFIIIVIVIIIILFVFLER